MGLRASAVSGILCALLSIPVGLITSVNGGLISNAGLPLLLYAFSILCIWPFYAWYVHGLSFSAGSIRMALFLPAHTHFT